MNKCKAFLMLPLLFTLAALATASPNAVNFQGRITSSTGSLLPVGLYKMEFNIYDSVTGGAKLWGPFVMDGGAITGHGELPMVMGDGRFNVILGPTDTNGKLIGDAFASGPAYIEMKAGDDAPFPRQPFRSAPYAFHLPNVNPKQNGYVGIGAVNPSAALEVAGSLHVLTDLRTTMTVSCTDLECSGPIVGIGTFPIGSIIAWDKTLATASGLSLSSQWSECDGARISDPASPLNLQFKPNLNSPAATGMKGYFLRGDSVSGTAQTDTLARHSHTYQDYYYDTDAHKYIIYANSKSTYAGNAAIRSDTMGDYVGEETRPVAYTVVWIIRIK